MDEETLQRAIEPFFSTKGIGRGTGLGLSMVHGLASQLGGALSIQSRPGFGTRIELWLPQSPELPRNEFVTTSPDMERRVLGIALLVDDDALVRASTPDMLVDLGYEVLEASSGEYALRFLRDDRPFDILVTDHLMPGLTGTQLARLVQTSRPAVPVLLVSGYGEREGLDPDIPRLAKPFRKSELASSLASLG